MVRVGRVRMRMRQRRMVVKVIMRLAGLVGRLVLVLVMRVVDVPVRVLHAAVDVLVRMALGEMQPDSQCHQGAGAERAARSPDRPIRLPTASAPMNGAVAK